MIPLPEDMPIRAVDGLPLTAVWGGGELLWMLVISRRPPLTGLVSGSLAGVEPTPRQKGAGLLCGRYWLGNLAVLGAVMRGS
jgi:hypothetical protein